MRRAKGSEVALSLFGLGIVMILLGFFGGALGMQRLTTLEEGPDHPDMHIVVGTNLAPGSKQKVMVMFLWYGHYEGKYYHGIGGVPVSCYLDGNLVGTQITDNTGYTEFNFPAPTQPGLYVVTVKFSGNSEYPAAEQSLEFTVKEPDSPAPQGQLSSSEMIPTVKNFLTFGGAALMVLGAGAMVFRRL